VKILRLQARAFRGLPDRTFDFTDPGTDVPLPVVIVCGDAGSGKTSLLEAIIAAKEDVGAYGRLPPASYLRAGERTARLEARWLLSPADMKRAGTADAIVTTVSVFGDGAPVLAPHPEGLRAVFREQSANPGRAKMEYFHASRALPRTRGGPLVSGRDPADARMRLDATNDKHRALRGWVVEAVQADNAVLADAVRARGVALGTGQFQKIEQLRELLRPFLVNKAFDGIDPEREGYRLRFVTPAGAMLDLEELSAREQQGVLFALTFHRLGLDHSIVLIDEPELHVHAAHRARFLQDLVGLGRDNQIIAATGSAEILAAARPAQIIALSARAEGVTA
jgi:predicted ATPase